MREAGLHGPWSAVRRAPMVRMAGPFVLGVAVAAGTEPGTSAVLSLLACASLALIGALLLPVDLRTRWRRGAALALWFMAFGAAWQAVRAPQHDAAHALNAALGEGHWLLEVSGINRQDVRSVSAEGALRAVLRGDTVEAAKGKVLLSLRCPEEQRPLRPGDRLLVTGALQRIARVPDPGGFDRRAWAASRGIALELMAMPSAWSVVGQAWHWSSVFDGPRGRISRWLESSDLNAREGALVKAMVLGERDELDSGRRDAFVRSGTIHVLAVSGMHVGLIYLVLSSLLSGLGKAGWARVARGALVLIGLWCYAGLTGASPSVMRASVMFSLFTVAGMARARTDHLNSLFAAAWLLLLWDPGMIAQASFQLSFLAVLGIILFQRPLERLWAPRSRWVARTWSLAVLSVSAQALTAPVSLLLFKGFPLWFLPANLVVVTAVGFAVYGSVALLLLHAVPVAGAVIGWGLRALIAIIDASTAFFAQLPWAYPTVRIGVWEALGLYALILGLGAWWGWRWRTGWYAAMIACALLLGAWSLRATEGRSRRQLVVYDQPKGFVAGMLVGRDLVVVASADSLLADPRVVSKLERHQRHAGIARILPAGTDWQGVTMSEHAVAVMAAGRLRTPGLDVLFASGSMPVPMKDRFDAILLHGSEPFRANALDSLAILGGPLVLTADVPGRTRRQVLAWAASRPVALHDIRGQGAFLLEAD